jgi:hypothetical protein
MKSNDEWVFPKIGDLVYRYEDIERDIDCVGVVLDIKEEERDKIRTDVRVLWAPDSAGFGGDDSWHSAYKLKVINESR